MANYNKKTDKYLEDNEKLIKVLQSIDAKTLNQIKRNYSSGELINAEERATYMQRNAKLREKVAVLDENGKFFPIASFLVGGMAVLGYFCAPFLEVYLKGLPLNVATSYIFSSSAAVLVNVISVGKVIIKYKAIKLGEVSEDVEESLLSLYDPIKLEEFEQNKEGEWLSLQQIKDEIEIDIRSIALGKTLKNLGFTQKRSANQRKYLVKRVVLGVKKPN
jgi:hypothetical protein